MLDEPSNATQPDSELAPRSIFLYWLPVIAALLVFAQVAVLGLRPSLAEERRLGDATQVLVDRYENAEQESDRLGRVLRAQQDPVLLERERREQLVDPQAPGQEH